MFYFKDLQNINYPYFYSELLESFIQIWYNILHYELFIIHYHIFDFTMSIDLYYFLLSINYDQISEILILYLLPSSIDF